MVPERLRQLHKTNGMGGKVLRRVGQAIASSPEILGAIAVGIYAIAWLWRQAALQGPGAQVLVVAVAALVLSFLAALIAWRLALFDRPAGGQWEPAQLSQWPRLEATAWAQETARLEELGFQRGQDWRLTPEVGPAEPQAMRLFYHPEHQCFARLVQSVPHRGKPSPLVSEVTSYLAEGWCLITTSQTPSPAIAALQLSRQLWFSVPGADSQQVLTEHLARRQEILTGLGHPIAGDRAFADYQTALLERSWRQRQIAKRLSTLGSFGQAVKSVFRPQRAWWNGYAEASQKQSPD